jgi:hypothetical protein
MHLPAPTSALSVQSRAKRISGLTDFHQDTLADMARLGSLGEAIDEFFAPKGGGPVAGEDAADCWKRRYTAWLFEVVRQPANHTAFESTLSSTQLVTHRALLEWVVGWTEGEDEVFNTAAERARQASSHDTLRPDHSYHVALASLHKYEFFYPPHFDRDNFRAYLRSLRQMALHLATCQRIAQCYVQSFEKPSKEPALPDLRSLLARRSMISPYLDSCSWLKLPQRDKGMPYYLWDVKSKRTRVVQEITEALGSSPEYVAVSHTWGRWRKPDEWTSLSGVPWRIPQNSRFKVERLPEILQDLPYDFVWLDLLTIPQEETSPAMVEIQKVEISRQTQIFRFASNVIAWLNDVPLWDGVQASLHWLCLAFLKQEGRNEITPSHSVDSLLKTPPNVAMFNELYENLGLPGFHPNAWFTSLWTLQEVCLRPDMLICNVKWEPLTIANDTCVSLVEIVALVRGTVSQLDCLQPPFGVRSLHGLVINMGLLYILQLSPPFILWMGNSRQCLHRRAEAIMSALGTTDWFQTSPTEEREQDLVLNVYPLAFLNEVRRKIGSGVFFSSGVDPSYKSDTALLEFCRTPSGYTGKLDAVGSLLPMGLGAGATTDDSNALSHYVEHPAVKSWIIEKPGSVRIREAGILSSEVMALGGQDWYVDGPSAEKDWNTISPQKRVDLQDWISSYKPMMPNYAVCIFQSPPVNSIRGVILKEIRPGVLIRVGVFVGYTAEVDVHIESQPVDWLVL